MFVRLWAIWLTLAAVLTLGGTVAYATEALLISPAGLVIPGQPASMPAFSLRDINGATMQAADLQSNVVVVRFWATCVQALHSGPARTSRRIERGGFRC